jgi:hypothetical protein
MKLNRTKPDEIKPTNCEHYRNSPNKQIQIEPKRTTNQYQIEPNQIETKSRQTESKQIKPTNNFLFFFKLKQKTIPVPFTQNVITNKPKRNEIEPNANVLEQKPTTPQLKSKMKAIIKIQPYNACAKLILLSLQPSPTIE